MRQAYKVASLQQLQEAGFPIKLQKPHSGTFEAHQLLGRVEIEPDEVLRLQISTNSGNTAWGAVGFGPKLLAQQTAFLTPVKFVFGEDLTEAQLIGELPINGEASLRLAYQLLLDAILDACSKDLELKPAATRTVVSCVNPPDKKGQKNGQAKRTLPTKSLAATDCGLLFSEIKSQVELLSKQAGDELVEQRDGWRWSFSTTEFFQQINISLDEESGLLRCQANLVTVPREQLVVQMALAAFLLQAGSRLRFARGVMFEDPSTSETTIALEVSVPGEYSKILSPCVAVESLKTATRFTKLACEAISKPEIAKEYLCRRTNIDSQKLQEAFT